MANHSTKTLTPKIVLQRLKRVKAKVDKGNIRDFSKMCEKTLRNVTMGPILRKHGAVSRKGHGKPYHWNGLALNLKLAETILNETHAKIRKQRKAAKQSPKKSPTTKENFTEILTDKHLQKIADMVAEKSGAESHSNSASDMMLQEINNRLNKQYGETMELFKACINQLNTLDSIASQLDMVMSAEAVG